MRPKDFLRHYASQFQTVEIDSTFYGTPAASTVTSWNEKTPRDFIFAVKVPQVITHEKGSSSRLNLIIEKYFNYAALIAESVRTLPNWQLTAPGIIIRALCRGGASAWRIRNIWKF